MRLRKRAAPDTTLAVSLHMSKLCVGEMVSFPVAFDPDMRSVALVPNLLLPWFDLFLNST